MADTIETLKQLAQQVRNATAEGENTAERVGRTLVGIIEHLGDGGDITQDELKEMLKDYPTKQDVEVAMANYVTTAFFARIFGLDGEDGAQVDINDTEAVITAVKVKFGLYSESFVSAKGLNPESGSEPGGATTLAALTDVSITTTPKDGQVLAYDITMNKWKPVDMEATAGIDEAQLADYLTTNKYAKKADITSALTDYALKTTRIKAGTGLTGGGTLAQDVTLSLATVGTAGTYTKVTVDSYGRVTGHASLAQSDIPALAISKITGLHTALDAKLNKSVFEEMFEKVWVSGYGYAIRAKLAFYSDDWMSAKGSNPDAGSVSAGLDEKQLAEYLTEHGYATQSWVNQQGFLKSVAWGDVTGKPTWIGSTKPTYTAAEVGALTQTTANGLYVLKSGDTMTGQLTVNSSYPQLTLVGTANAGIRFHKNNETVGFVGYFYTVGAFLQCGDHYINVNDNGNALIDNLYTLWHNGNDGSGSGLDADLLDGKHYSDIINGNVYSATRLQTTRMLWGQSFNGTANVSGDMTGVGGITASGNIRGLAFYMTEGGGIYYANGTTYLDGREGEDFQIRTSGGTSIPTLAIYATTTKFNGSIQIGNGTISWDSTNNCFHFSNGLYSDGFISAKGGNSSSGSAVAGASALSELEDVTISSPSNGQTLVYRNGVWKNETVSGGGSSSVAWADVTGKPSWIPNTDGSGSGIDADLLDGTHKSGLFTAMTYAGSTLSLTIGGVKKSVNIETSAVIPTVTVSSSSSRNLSVNVGGSTDYVNDLYATYSTYADYLRTARTIWGQSFNGGSSVSGALTGVTTITASGNIKGLAFYLTEGGGIYYTNGTTYLDGREGKNFQIRTSGGTSIPTLAIYATTTKFNGSAYATGGFQNGSDIRYKHVLSALPLTVAQVAAAPSFLFRWTDGTADGVQAGTSAQYWQQVMPQVVTESAGRLSMQYDKAALAAVITTARTVIDHEQRIRRLEDALKVAV